MASKEDFLDRLADRMGRPRIRNASEVKKPQWNRHPWDHMYKDDSQGELVDCFEQSLTALGGVIVKVPSADQLPERIQEWIAQNDIKNVVAWNHPSAQGDALREALRPPENQAHDVQVTFWDEDGEADELIPVAEKADVGFTIAEHGLAETGTVVLYNRGHCGRLVSLLPTVCAMVLSAQKVVPRLTQLLPYLEKHAPDYSCMNLITGPSRSADIEMDLSIGVHGPGQIVIFLVED